MGLRRCHGPVVLLLAMAMSFAGLGCQFSPPGMGSRLAAHAARLNIVGLSQPKILADVNVKADLPCGWEALPVDTGTFFTHQQWRSLTHATGLGVVYLHLPIPMSAKSLIWLGKSRYESSKSGKKSPATSFKQWTDSVGRECVEIETEKYHVKAFVVSNGFQAWVMYAGYRLKTPLDPLDFGLALHSMESVVPLPLADQEKPAK